MINLMIIYDVVNIFSMKNYKSSRKLGMGLNWYPGVNWSTTTKLQMYMINLMIIYNVVNIFSMKIHKSSRKLRVGVNWYPGVNWSTTTILGVILCTSSGILPVNAHAEANILNLNYINRFIFYSSFTRLSNDVHSN